MALVGGPGDPAAPQGAGPPPSGLVFTDFGADSGGGPGGAGAGVGNELGAALAGLSFHPAPSPGQAASESMPIAIPGGHAGLRRPGGLGGPGPSSTFIPVDAAGAAAAGATTSTPAHHHHHHGVASSPGGTGDLAAAFATACELDGTPSRLGPGGAHGPLGVPTGASASAGAAPLLAGIDEEEDIDLDFGFGEDDDDLLRALDTAPRTGPPPPGGSALWAEYGASAPAAPASGFDAFFPPSSVGPSAPARHPATVGFAAATGASPAALLAHEPAVAASDHDAWSFPAGAGAAGAGPPSAASMPSAMLSPAHARGGGGGGGGGPGGMALPPHFHRAPSAPSLAPQWGTGTPHSAAPPHHHHYHHHHHPRGGFVVSTPPVGSAPGVGFHVGSVGTSGAPLSSSLSGSVGRSRSGGGGGFGPGRPLSASSPALKHSASHGALARAAAVASRAGRVSRPPRRPLDDDDGSFDSGSFGAAGSAGGGSGSIGGRGAGGGRKHHNPWSVEETEALVAGVEACGGGKWADIKKLGWAAMGGRSAVDLKDKWRNLTRLVSLPSALPRAVARSAGEPSGEKRRLPPELLERVRALMPADPDLPYGRITASRAPGARSRARNRR